MKRLLLALLVAATPAVAADRFDLTCTGTRIFHDPLAPRDRALPYATELRIDMIAGRYCYGECQRTRAVAGATGQVIVLAKAAAPDGQGSPSEDSSFDRATGRLTSTIAAIAPDMQSSKIDAACATAAFKGFPDEDAHY